MTPTGPRHSADKPARILVRGVNWLGDAVMTTPALQRLRERFPETEITLLTHKKLAGLWLNHPSLHHVVSFSSGEKPWAIANRLRAAQYDLALILPNSPRSTLECWLARIPKRVGLARPWRNWLLTTRVTPRPAHVEMHKRSDHEVKDFVQQSAGASPEVTRILFPSVPSAHHIHSYLHLTAALGADASPLPPLLAVTPAEVRAAAHKFELPEPSPKRPVLALNPGAEYGPAKRWPIERFIEAAKSVQQRTNCIWLILGGSSDVALANEICAGLNTRPPSTSGEAKAVHVLAGRTSLRELMAVLKLSSVLLTNDTGPMHVAAALGTPVVVPFGSTSPKLTAPGLPGDSQHYLLTANAPCSPCFRRTCPIDFRCMTGIPASKVVEAIEQASKSFRV